MALTIFELLPPVYEDSNVKTTGVFIMLGILLQIFLEFFSKGAEHGHVHLDSEKSDFPWLLFVSLSIHSFLEGFPVEKNNTILYGILIHKIPIAVILSIFLLNSKIKLINQYVFKFTPSAIFQFIIQPFEHAACHSFRSIFLITNILAEKRKMLEDNIQHYKLLTPPRRKCHPRKLH